MFDVPVKYVLTRTNKKVLYEPEAILRAETHYKLVRKMKEGIRERQASWEERNKWRGGIKWETK